MAAFLQKIPILIGICTALLIPYSESIKITISLIAFVFLAMFFANRWFGGRIFLITKGYLARKNRKKG